VHGGPFNLAQALAIPVFMLALAVVWSIAQASQQRGPRLGAGCCFLVQFLLLRRRPSSDRGVACEAWAIDQTTARASMKTGMASACARLNATAMHRPAAQPPRYWPVTWAVENNGPRVKGSR